MAKKLADLLVKMPPERRARAHERAQTTLTEMALQELSLGQLPGPAELKTMRPAVSEEE